MDGLRWWQVQITVPTEAAEAVAALLSEWPEVGGVAVEGAVAQEPAHPEWGEWFDDSLLRVETQRVTVYVPDPADPAALRDRARELLKTVERAGVPVTDTAEAVEVTGVEDTDWEEAWKRDYHPIPVGQRLVIIPTWERDAAARWPDRQPIWLEPGMAFGTGTHTTTQLCLEALEHLGVQGRRVLDVGCGTAVLAIAAAKLGAVEVTAIDIDPVAVHVAEDNVQLNEVADRVTVRQGDLLTGIGEQARYDVVIANILRDIVVRLTPQVVPRLAAGGRFVVSGFVDTQAPAVEAAFRGAGLRVADRLQRDDWVVLMGERMA